MVDPVEPAGSPEPPSLRRPVPDRLLSDRLGAWLAWFGLARLVATAISVAAVGAGAFWLLRAPAPPVEANLPVAASSSTLPTSTLPVPAAPPTTVSTPAVIVVHVAGAVGSPGVYELDGSRRVHDAIGRAGGATVDADLDALNLAQELADGQRLYVPTVDEREHVTAPYVTPVITGSAAADGITAPAGPIDLNRATVAELETLPGIGPSTAAAIVDDRERNGPFASVDDLERVPGIGPAKLDALRDQVVV